MNTFLGTLCRQWNAHQPCEYKFNLSNTSALLLFEHKNFLVDLFDEWGSSAPLDIYTFLTIFVICIFRFIHLALRGAHRRP